MTEKLCRQRAIETAQAMRLMKIVPVCVHCDCTIYFSMVSLNWFHESNVMGEKYTTVCGGVNFAHPSVVMRGHRKKDA